MGLDQEGPTLAVFPGHSQEHTLLGVGVQKAFGREIPGQKQHRAPGCFGQGLGEEHLADQRFLRAGEGVEESRLGVFGQLFRKQGGAAGALGFYGGDAFPVAPVEVSIADRLP